RARRAVPALRLSQRSAVAAARRPDARDRRAGAADLRHALEERDPPRHRAPPDPVGAAALVGQPARRRGARPDEARVAGARVKLGVVTTSYPRTPDDPAGNFVEAHVHALRRLGHEVEVIAAGAGTTPGTRRVPSALFYRGGAPDRLERHPLRSLAA